MMCRTEYAEGGAKLHHPPHQDRVKGPHITFPHFFPGTSVRRHEDGDVGSMSNR